MSAGVWVLIVAVVGAGAFGLFRALTDGRFRGTHQVHGAESDAEPAPTSRRSVLDGTPWADDLGERATLLQFSSAFCAPCRATRRVLGGRGGGRRASRTSRSTPSTTSTSYAAWDPAHPHDDRAHRARAWR